MKTSELTGAALDWAVHVALHGSCKGYAEHEYSTNWAQGGPIIEMMKINLWREDRGNWCASYSDGQDYWDVAPLTAAMRCYVASVMGDNIAIPEEFTK